MENLSGTSIKGYELRERIGAGGFGAVYRAYQSSVGREVAIKIVLPHFANHPDFIRRFEAEAGLVARLEHPHIIPLYDYWRDSSGAYLVMRWLRSGSLSEALKDGPYELRAAALLLDQVTSALSLAHRNNVIHRDLKPANILLDEDGNAYVADFGIAKDMSKLSAGTTQADAVVGSPDYLSPEQARSESVSPQTDIYSLGVMLYELLTGQHPFPNATPIERMFKHLNEPLPQVGTLAPEVTGGVNTVIQTATAKNPAHRYGDVLEMAIAFQEAAGLLRQRNGDSVVEILTQREQEVLQRIVIGEANKQIAQELVISLATVKWYVNEIYSKLHVRNRVQAIVRARELNLITNGHNVLASDSSHVPTNQFAPENPYKGLRAFQAADTQDFLGREVLTDKLVKRLNEPGDMSRFLAVIGPSGSGKSSLIKAGLIPALWRGALPGSERWFVAEMLPGSHPLDELEIALTRIASQQPGNLREQLQRDERGLLRVAQLVLPSDGSQVVLVIDQFEEVFTLVEDEKVRVHFLSLIHEAVADPRSRVQVVITLRADFYDRPLLYPDFGELVRSRMETVLPLTAEGLERAIARPAERVGVTFEEGLVSTIVSEVNYQPGALPLLQYALTELFDRRQGRVLTHEVYEEIGGIVGALARRADEIYEGWDAESQEAACQMFMRLVTLGEGVEDTRRRVPRSELMAIAADADTMDDIIDTYAAYRLLSLDHDPITRSPTVELAHEAILREWKRLRGWLNDSRHEIRLQRLLATAAAEWVHAKRDDSFLLRGSRLEQFQTWATDTTLALTPKERDYLDASLTDRERQTLAEQKRQLRETRLERRSRNFLRGLVAVLLLATVGALGLTAAAVNQGNIAQSNFIRAERTSLSARAQVALSNGQSSELPALLALRSLQYGYSPDGDATLGQALARPFTRQLFANGDHVTSAVFSSDARSMLTASFDDTVRIWDVRSGQEKQRFTGQKGWFWSAVFSPDGQSVLTGGTDKTVRVWSTKTGEQIHQFNTSLTVRKIAYSSNSKLIIVVTSNDFEPGITVLLWDAQTYKELHRFSTVNAGWAALSPDSRSVASVGGAGVLSIWDVATETFVHQDTTDNNWQEVIYSPDGKYIAAAGTNTIWLWDATTWKEVRQFVGDSGNVSGLSFSPDSKYLASGSNDNKVLLWNVETGESVHQFIGHHDFIWSVAFSPDGQWLLSGSHDGTARLWDVQPAIIPLILAHGAQVTSVEFSQDSHSLLTGSADSITRLWDVQSGTILKTFSGSTAIAIAARFSPDGRSILTVTRNGESFLANIQTGEFRMFVGSNPNITAGIFSPDGDAILTGGGDIVELWDAKTLTVLHQYKASGQNIRGIAFSPDGKTIATASVFGTVQLWDVDSEAEVYHFSPHAGAAVYGVAFSPDGQYLVTVSDDTTAKLWDMRTKQEIRRFSGHNGKVNAVAFSGDGRFIVTAGDQTARVWDVATGQEVRRFFGDVGGVLSVAFSPDGRYIATGSEYSKAQIWLANLQDTVAFACQHLPRDFTDQERGNYQLDDKPTCLKDSH